MNIIKSTLPDNSILKNIPCNYADSYSAVLDARKLSIEQVDRSFFASGPAWVSWLFVLRNRIVALIGLKTSRVSKRDATTEKFNGEVGERVGLFIVLDKNECEIIMGENDKHLDFRISLFLDKQNNKLIVSTIVKIHNNLGRLYMLVIKPFHKLIVPTMMKGMVRQLSVGAA